MSVCVLSYFPILFRILLCDFTSKRRGREEVTLMLFIFVLFKMCL